MSRPANLIYGVDDVPPASILFMLAVQHIFLMSSTLVLPIVLMSEISGDIIQTRALVALTMISCGIGTVLQAGRWRGIGTGFLCPNLCGPNFFAASIGAAWRATADARHDHCRRPHRGCIRAFPASFGIFCSPRTSPASWYSWWLSAWYPLGSAHFLHVDYAGEPIQVASLAVAADYIAHDGGAQYLGWQHAKAVWRADWFGPWLLAVGGYRFD